VGSTENIADANAVVFDETYSNVVDGDDAIKFANDGENLGILRSSLALAIEGRQPVSSTDTIYFKMWNMQPHNYKFEFIPSNLSTQNLTAKLEDSYLNSSTVIDLSDTTVVSFVVNGNVASYAMNRFRIVFASSVVLPVNFISIDANRKEKDVQVNWKVGNELNIHHYETEQSMDGRSFAKQGSTAATGNTSYSYLDLNVPSGTLFYRVKSVGIAGDINYSSIVKVAAERENARPGYVVAPNPIEGLVINLWMKNQPQGRYKLRLLSTAGQEIQTYELLHSGGNSTQILRLPAGLARGTYQLEITAPDKSRSIQTVFINN
jgi:hypothetical protein